MGTPNSALRDDIADAIGTAFDDDGGGVAVLEIRASDETVLATISLDADAFGAASAGQVSANNFPKTVTASATGTADHARLEATASGGGTDEMISAMSVGTSSAEVVLDNLSINNGQDVTINSVTIGAPTSSTA